MTPSLFGTPKIESWNHCFHLSALKIADLKKPSTLQPLPHNFALPSGGQSKDAQIPSTLSAKRPQVEDKAGN